MNKNFVDWYRIANIDPTSEQLDNRLSGIKNFIENYIEKDYIFELVKMFYNHPTQETFYEKYVECFIDVDSVFDKSNKAELAVLAGATLVEIIENYDYNFLPMFAVISFSFLETSPIVPDILKIIKNNFIKETCSTREKILEVNDITYTSEQSSILIKELKKNEMILQDDLPTLLINYISETNKSLKILDEKQKYDRKINNIYAEDSQILWWMTGEWINDLDKSLHEVKQADASIIIGKELADKIDILPGPYSAKAVIHKMLDCCNKKNKCKTIALRDIIENSDVEWKTMCLKKYDVNRTQEITPIILAMSKSLTVDEGEDWNPQFKKIVGYSAEDVIKPVEEIDFQMYLECLTIKCYDSVED
ncbi:hypothetical protein FCV19_10830 [Clostridium botulinum]|nr:hypothetical protein [Clostridium botulinum]